MNLGKTLEKNSSESHERSQENQSVDVKNLNATEEFSLKYALRDDQHLPCICCVFK